MKCYRAICFVMFIILLVAGCSPVDRDAPVFETEGIRRIVFLTQPDGEAEVRESHMAEITAWLATFRIGEKIKGDGLPPGSNSICVSIEYEDGRTVECGLSAIEREGVFYELVHEDAPDCYFAVLEGE